MIRTHCLRSMPKMSRSVALGTFLLLGGALGVPDLALAQHYRFGTGFTVGGSLITDLNPDAPAEAQPISPGAGFVFGLHLDRWYGPDGRMGVRVQGAYQQPRFDWSPGERKIGAGSADVSAMFRVTPPAQDAGAVPYLTAGAGGIWYDLGTGDPTSFQAADAYHDGGSRILPLVLLGAGVDVDVPWDWQGSPMRLRAEVADHMSFGSPIRQASDGSRYGPVHHLRVTVGLHSTFDLRR